MKRTVFAVSTLLVLCFAPRADAYLDPGSGSMVLQVLLGGLAGVALVVKLFWHRILQIFGMKGKENSKESQKS
jgi:hypothetical protein